MEMIKIPHNDLEVSRLALGCMGLGGGWEADPSGIGVYELPTALGGL